MFRRFLYLIIAAFLPVCAYSEMNLTLPEVVFKPTDKQVLHLIGYVREYSSLSSYSDTVFLFREKTVDFMVPGNKCKKFKGWKLPRVLASRSYYRFSNSEGLDSVSDRYAAHFSWSDWIGISGKPLALPATITLNPLGTDTLHAKYAPSLIWTRNNDNVTLEVNVTADTLNYERWTPGLTPFVERGDANFERVKLKYNFIDVTDSSVGPGNIESFSYLLESSGRGEAMRGIRPTKRACFVDTYAEVFIVEREYLPVRQAKKWLNHPPKSSEIGIITSPDAPGLDEDIIALIDRVDNIDHDATRLILRPDERLVSNRLKPKKKTRVQRVLRKLKALMGM